MPETIRTTVSATVGGTTYTAITDAAGDSVERATPSIPAAKIGSLTTRTDANTGVLTMASGHGFISTDVIDVFWATGSRRGMTATVATNAVTVDGGAGDDLPVVSTAVTAMKPVEVPFAVDGDEVVGLVASSPVAGYVVFVDDADAEIAAATYEVGASSAGVWAEAIGTTNPLAGKTTTVVKFSHGDVAARTMTAIAVFN